MHVVVAVPAQSMAYREPRRAVRVGSADDAHALQVIVDDRVPLLVREDALPGLDGQRAVPHAVPAVLPVGIEFPSTIAGEGVVLAFPDPIASVEPSPDLRIRFGRTAIEAERAEQVVAACDEVLVGVLVVTALAEQILH